MLDIDSASPVRHVRRLPIGAEVLPEGGVRFRVWAPGRHRVGVAIDHGPTVALDAEPGGYWSGRVARAGPGTRYRFRLDDDQALPDPASRFQPGGPHGPSEVIDPDAFAWTDRDWPGIGSEGQVLYEMHIGTFTPEGTYAAAMARLPALKEIGITAIELMPVAEFPGRFGWGYDGVDLFAPTRLYGRPDDLRRFIDRAHSVGLGVIHDVVYNHLGPDGNYLKQVSPDYFTSRYKNEWGESINFDGPESGPVREFFIGNAAYWIGEYHFDGLRLDATQSIHDASPSHVLKEITAAVRQAAGGRRTLVIAENEPQNSDLVRPVARGGMGMDALWNDDFHHSAMVMLTGRHEAYYTDHRGRPQEFVAAAKYGCLYQGQYYTWQGKRRGNPAFGLPASCFVNFVQNHDQIANTARGMRGHAISHPGRWRAMTALLLLMPGTPMLFQGQEFSASAPFLYFTDQKPELTESIRRGRKAFLAQFAAMQSAEAQEHLPDPADPESFAQCRLDWAERETHAEAVALHRDLLALRRGDAAFRAETRTAFDGAVLDEGAFVLRYFAERRDDRLLIVNFGNDLDFKPAPEPLLAPPRGRRWKTVWSSEAFAYGGAGEVELETAEGWVIPGNCAAVLAPVAGEKVAGEQVIGE